MDLKIVRSLIPHQNDPLKNVEIFWNEPREKQGLILLLHGHHPGVRIGARNEVASGMLEFFAENGWVCVAVSQPGYGRSDGPPDYCGPFTQAAVQSVVSEFIRKEIVDESRIGVMGWSRGANVAALSAARDSRFRFAILGGGLHDLVRGYDGLSDGIRASLARESDGSFAALKERSPIYASDRLKVPTLILHGAQDSVASVKHAMRFHDRLIADGAPARLEVFEQYGHAVALHVIADAAGRFLSDHGFMEPPNSEYGLNRFEPVE